MKNLKQYAINVAFIGTVLPFVTWILYMAIMTLYRAREDGKLSGEADSLGRFVLYIGLLADFLLNMIIGTLLFLELPREWLLSPRVERLQREGKGYRKAVARWICHHLLDPFDPSGCHCK